MYAIDRALATVVTRLRGLAHRRAAWHWTRVTKSRSVPRLRWWESPAIVRHVNETICGDPLDQLGSATRVLLARNFPDRIFERAVSVGCGSGRKELALLQSGLIKNFQLYELSKARVEQGKALANELGLSQRAAFHIANGLAQPRDEEFDLVHWNNALHHMTDVEAAVAWSWHSLRPGGVFFMDEFVGPDRMQWSARMLRMANRVRSALPGRCLADPHNPSKRLRRRVRRPSQIKMFLSDPTECADSSRILPSVRKWFPDAEIKPTGGTIYHLTLNDILHNIDEIEDADLLVQLLRIDDLCMRLGEYHYAVAMGVKHASFENRA